MLKMMKYHLVVGSLLTLLVTLYRRIGTGVFNERRHIGRGNLVGALT